MKNILSRIVNNTFLRNFTWLSAGEICSRAIGMFSNILIVRFLSPENYGIYALVLTYISILSAVSSLGLSQLTIRSIARDQSNSLHFLFLSLMLRIAGFILAVILFGLYYYVGRLDFSGFVIFAILAGVFLENIWIGFQNTAFGMQRMEWNSIINVSASALLLIIYICMPRSLFTLNVLLTIHIGAYLFRTAGYYISLKKGGLLSLTSKEKRATQEELRVFLKDSLPFYLLTILGLFTNQFPSLFLEHNSGVEELAYFSTANKLLLPLTMFLNIAISAFFPNQSQLYEKDKDRFSKQTVKIIWIVSLIGILAAFIVSAFRKEIVFLIYGEQYRSTADVMAWQCWYIVMYAIFCFNGSTLGAADAQRKLSVCSVVYAIISTPILYFSSRYGANGLSIGYVVASIINIMYIFPVLRKVLNNSLTWRFYFTYLLVFILSLATSMSISQSISIWMRIVIVIIVLSIIYLSRNKISTFIKKI